MSEHIYTYVDHSQNSWDKGKLVAPTIFECKASNILEADKLFKEKWGKDVTKMPHIGCSICIDTKESGGIY